MKLLIKNKYLHILKLFKKEIIHCYKYYILQLQIKIEDMKLISNSVDGINYYDTVPPKAMFS